MSSARKRRTGKGKGEPDYDPSVAHQFPFGAPGANKPSPKGDLPSTTPQKSHAAPVQPTMKRRTQDVNSVDASAPKSQKTTAEPAVMTAFQSAQKKRKVGSTASTIDELSVKQSKVPKMGQESPKKRKSVKYGNVEVSAKRKKTGLENFEDDIVMEDAQPDTPESTEPKLGEKTAATTSPAKRDVPISLESLAREEEAAKAAKTDAKKLTQAASQSAVPQAEASNPSSATSSCKCIAA